ncbi:MAG: hypothetical protein BA864_00555 [Desulfuromonadales bacterium C00003093]|nr:MAG: hypothetical protein BA864_00555 [Desulfuromonadales bacterium C00003093]
MDLVIQECFQVWDQRQALAGSLRGGKGTAVRPLLGTALFGGAWGGDQDPAEISQSQPVFLKEGRELVSRGYFCCSKNRKKTLWLTPDSRMSLAAATSALAAELYV